jgi:hypothetical protein
MAMHAVLGEIPPHRESGMSGGNFMMQQEITDAQILET